MTVKRAPKKAEKGPDEPRPGIVLRPSVVEALLVAVSSSDSRAAVDVANQIREIAEQQGYSQF